MGNPLAFDPKPDRALLAQLQTRLRMRPGTAFNDGAPVWAALSAVAIPVLFLPDALVLDVLMMAAVHSALSVPAGSAIWAHMRFAGEAGRIARPEFREELSLTRIDPPTWLFAVLRRRCPRLFALVWITTPAQMFIALLFCIRETRAPAWGIPSVPGFAFGFGIAVACFQVCAVTTGVRMMMDLVIRLRNGGGAVIVTAHLLWLAFILGAWPVSLVAGMLLTAFTIAKILILTGFGEIEPPIYVLMTCIPSACLIVTWFHLRMLQRKWQKLCRIYYEFD